MTEILLDFLITDLVFMGLVMIFRKNFHWFSIEKYLYQVQSKLKRSYDTFVLITSRAAGSIAVYNIINGDVSKITVSPYSSECYCQPVGVDVVIFLNLQWHGQPNITTRPRDEVYSVTKMMSPFNKLQKDWIRVRVRERDQETPTNRMQKTIIVWYFPSLLSLC